MSLACPNKSSKEWKMLVSQTGEDLANLAFVANGYRIPDVKTATEIKRAIAFKPLVESYAGMAHRLRKYNEQNGTSHYFTMEKVYGNTYKLEFKYNYLPVNVEKQRQRMAAKGDPLYVVNDFDADSFSNMYPINVAAVKPKPPTSTPGEQLSLFSVAAEPLMPRPVRDYKQSELSRVYFNNTDQVTTKELLSNIVANDRVMAPIARHLFKYTDINNVNVSMIKDATAILVPNTKIEAIGIYYPNTNKISIPEKIPVDAREETMVHEVLHALSYKALRENGKFTQAFQKLYEKSVKELGGYDDQTNIGEYANYTIDEFFVALFTNGAFITKLQNLPPINDAEFDNLLEEIFSYILGVLGLEKGTTLYSQAFAVATNILEDTSQMTQMMRASEMAYQDYMQSEEYQRDLAEEAEISKQVLGSNPRTGGLKPGVQELFDSNPELSTIGNQQQYSQYLTTIFPDSQLKNINYHGTEYSQKFEKFDPKLAGTQTAEELITPGFWFTYSKSFAEDFGDNVISVLLNIQNPFNAKGSLDDYTGMTIFPDQVESVNRAIKEGYDSAFVDVLENLETGRAHSELVVFNPENIHILGSQKDIDGFRKFINSGVRTDESLSKGITPNDRIVFGHPTIGKSFLKNQGEDKFISLDDDYATEINAKVREIAGKYNVTIYQVKDGGTQTWNNEYNQMMQEMFNVAKQRAFAENKTLFTSNTNLLINNANSFDKVINLTDAEFEKRIQERGAKYDTKVWKSQINTAISKIPANKVITTNKYLSDLFITPQTTRQVYQGYNNEVDNRGVNYFAVNKEEAAQYGQNVRAVTIDTSNFLNRDSEAYDKLYSEYRTISEEPFDILDNSAKGLANQQQFFDFLKSKGYKGLDYSAFIDSQYLVAFEDVKIFNNRTDEILESAYTQVEAVEKKRENKINMEIMRQRQLLKNVKDSDEMTKIMAKIEKLKKESDIAEGRVILSKSINSFEDVLEFGNKEIGEIRKLLAKPAVSADDAYYAQRVLDLWIKAGDFSTSPQEHIILDEDEFNTSEDVVLPDGTVIPSIRSKFRAIASQAQDLQGRLTEVKKAHTTAFVQQYADGRLTTEDIYKHIADVNKAGTLTLNISRHNDPMMQTAFLAVEEANMLAQQEAAEVWQRLDILTPKFLKKAGGNFNILKQLTADGKETGRVVHRFSTEFFDTRNTLMNNAFRAKDISGKLKKDPADIKMYFDWINANTITFDVRVLFPDSELENKTLPNKFIYDNVTFTEEEKAKHIADLKAQLGEKGYRFYLQQAKTKLEKFKELRQAVYESYQMEAGLSEAEKDVLFTEWLKESSPYWGIDMNDNPSSRKKEGEGFYAPRGVRDYAIQVPRRSVNGVATKWYDKNFTKIEADDDLLEYHEFLMKTLNQMRYLLPQQKVPMMGVGVLPTIEKNLMDIFAEKGMMIGVVPFWDKMKQLQTTTDFATNVYSDVNPATKEIEKNIQVKYISDTDSEVREIVKQKKIKHKQETGIPATLEQIKVFRNEAKDYLSKQKSWDVTKIMKAYTMEVLAHKHKSLIEPQIRLLDQAFKDKKEIVTNKAGGAQKKDGEVLDKQGLANLRSAWEYFFDSTYYNIGARKVEGVGKKKLYTAQETKEKKELEGLIAKEDDAESKEFLQRRLDNLGGNKTLSGTGDAVLKYMTLKGLGYNLFSGVSNMGFGLISNLIEASGGQNYSMKNFRKASMLVANSIGRNLSFNTLFSNPNGNAVKIRTLMDKWDLNSTSTKEMFDMSNKSSLTKLKRFGPFSIQERSEYVNIAPVMIAIMMEFAAKDPDGKTVTMWDAYEPSTGKLKAGYTTEVDEVKMFQKIKRVVEMNHGDYYNQLQVKETIAGRALSQFRTWMFEGFATRFESEKPLPDYALSYGSDEPYIRKGRYRSYTKGQLLTTGAAVGTAFLPGIGTAVGAGIGYIGGRFFGMHTNDNAVSDVLFTLKQLARKLMFQKTQFGDKFSKTDAANMRKNMTELYIMLTLMGTAMVLKGLAGADDDDEDDTISNFLINQTIRLRTDISFYSNPLEFEKLTKTALPMAQLVSDVHVLFTDIGNYYGEDSADKSIFESGPFKGDPKWFIHMAQLLPGTSQLVRLYRTGDKVMD